MASDLTDSSSKGAITMGNKYEKNTLRQRKQRACFTNFNLPGVVLDVRDTGEVDAIAAARLKNKKIKHFKPKNNHEYFKTSYFSEYAFEECRVVRIL